MRERRVLEQTPASLFSGLRFGPRFLAPCMHFKIKGSEYVCVRVCRQRKQKKNDARKCESANKKNNRFRRRTLGRAAGINLHEICTQEL
jgi:hypothetical protein